MIKKMKNVFFLYGITSFFSVMILTITFWFNIGPNALMSMALLYLLFGFPIFLIMELIVWVFREYMKL